jgi:hypothetical protein
MRTTKAKRIAGNCCCLGALVILLVLFGAAVIGTAVLWKSANQNVFRWESTHHRSDAYRNGYQQGNRLGAEYARRGDSEPREQELDDLAQREADRLNIRRNRGQWIQGFRNGFARGFESSSNQAFYNPGLPLRSAFRIAQFG